MKVSASRLLRRFLAILSVCLEIVMTASYTTLTPSSAVRGTAGAAAAAAVAVAAFRDMYLAI